MRRNGIGVVAVLLTLACVFHLAIKVHAQEDSKSEFERLMESKQVIAAGENVELSESSYARLVNSAGNHGMSQRSAADGKVILTPEDILEIHYYSLTDEERESFLNDIAGQRAHVSSGDGWILFSYSK